ncbi:calcium-binding protein [Stenotrophomonas sp.]|uniref:calcium-binding protein n=1 Tax=Stenotrophomonas sp. TaxID=69392 RepID=UPI0028AA6541|nr:calcium-binding protein [Stenotrophomonas sp.]
MALAAALACASASAALPEGQEEIAARIVAHAGDHRLIVLGELHGTRETPLLVQALMESYAADGLPVQLGIELPETENAALSTYLASNGDAAARLAVRDGGYWRVRNEANDGRRSQDMLDMIEAVRVLRAQGRDVQVFGFDRIPPAEEAVSGSRDAAMASVVRERHARLPATGRLLVLTGNIHGSREQRSPATLTWLIGDLPLYNVRIEARGGEFWGCRGYRRCGSLPLVAYDGPQPKPSTAADRSYDLWVFLPRFSAARLLDVSGATR